jgi:hypothetical protein
MANGIIPGVIRGKSGHFAVVGPVTAKRVATTKKMILKFQCKSGRKKLGYVPPVQGKIRELADVRFTRINLAGILIEFGEWMNQCEPLKAWSEAKKRDVLRELLPAAVVATRLAKDLQQKIPEWDGTKHQLHRFRS